MPAKPRSRLHALIGGRVRQLRQHRGWTQAYLAELIDRSNHFVSGIERGVDSPSLTTLEKLAEALGTTIALLVDQEEKPERMIAYDLEQLLGRNQDPRLVRVIRDVVELYDAKQRKRR